MKLAIENEEEQNNLLKVIKKKNPLLPNIII
jgi:hypothetical protein